LFLSLYVAIFTLSLRQDHTPIKLLDDLGDPEENIRFDDFGG
jgi:Na+-transporting NADH:ubiquinone oxidoreductase subunit NqrF